MVAQQVQAAKIESIRQTEELRAYSRIFSVSFDGEKSLGGIGDIKKYFVDYEALRLRSWQLYLESEICQTVFKRFATWIIGAGLKLQAEPQKDVLKSERIDIDEESFDDSVETRFRIFANSVNADYAEQESLHGKAKEAFINAIVGGDVLVILRYVDNFVKVEIKDGCHVKTPMEFVGLGNEAKLKNGNRIRHGVEIDDRGRHVAYYLCNNSGYERIEAKGKAHGATMAFMIYGLKYRLDSTRGIPLIAAVMETAKKMERYKEATLGSAEERQKIPYTIEHDFTSTGENPFQKQIQKANVFGGGAQAGPLLDDRGQYIADTIARTTERMAFNMPIGSKLSSLKSDGELYFKDFYTINIHLVCSTIGIPPEVALAKYDSNFSASRAALKDWEHTINVARQEFSSKFYKNVYALWLDTQVLSNKIVAPGYITALTDRNMMALEAYRNARFVGANVPHIDPLKEVNAERAKLGDLAANVPLTTVEAATEALNGGDSFANLDQFAKELAEFKKLVPTESVVIPSGS